MRSRASRRRLSDNDIGCSASDRRWFPARPAQHVHRRRNNGKGRIQSALASAHGRNGKRRVETCSAGRTGAHRPSKALHPIRLSDVLARIARERVPCATRLKQRRKIDSFLSFASFALLGERLHFGDFRRRKPEIHRADDAVDLLWIARADNRAGYSRMA